MKNLIKSIRDWSAKPASPALRQFALWWSVFGVIVAAVYVSDSHALDRLLLCFITAWTVAATIWLFIITKK